MILHTGIDGGLHDMAAANLVAVLAWGALTVRMVAGWIREAIRRSRRPIDRTNESR